MQIAFIGGGVMGTAMIKGLLARKLVSPDAIIASDISPARLEALGRDYAIRTTSDNKHALEGREIVVLAIKPQNLGQVMAELKGHLGPEQLALSIVAGADLAQLSRGLAHNGVVRVMPNMPAQIGEGMSLWTATSQVSQKKKEAVGSILGALGKEIYVTDERYLDMATAVSGSGPAYIFLIIESLIDAAVHIGLPRDIAGELVLQTVLGAARFAQDTGKHPAELRNLVTSPGGTTAEGLLQLEEGGLRAILAQAVFAAHNKAEELRGANGK